MREAHPCGRMVRERGLPAGAGFSRAQEAATPKFEVKRYRVSNYRNDCMAVSSGSYSASHFAGAAKSSYPKI